MLLGLEVEVNGRANEGDTSLHLADEKWFITH